MTASARLERRYRRVLVCYPKAFRRESEDEILAVLLSTAHEGQRRVGLAESADLIKGAVRMHFGMSHSPRPVRDAVRYMRLGAVLNLAAGVTILVTLGHVRSAAIHDAAVQWHTVMLTQVDPVLVSAPIGAGLWLWLAWANGRGHNWARFAFAAIFLLLTVGLGVGLGDSRGADALTLLMPDLLAAMALWLAALVTMVLIFSPAASPYYQRRAATHAATPANGTSR